MPKLRNAFDRKRVLTHVIGDPMTKQADKDHCDINKIMARYISSGVLPDTQSTGTYGDYSEASDYHASQNLILEAQESFASLPSSVRAHFANDPYNLLAFVNDPNNYKEACELGLIDPAKQPNPVKSPEPALAPESLSNTPNPSTPNNPTNPS